MSCCWENATSFLWHGLCQIDFDQMFPSKLKVKSLWMFNQVGCLWESHLCLCFPDLLFKFPSFCMQYVLCLEAIFSHWGLELVMLFTYLAYLCQISLFVGPHLTPTNSPQTKPIWYNYHSRHSSGFPLIYWWKTMK